MWKLTVALVAIVALSAIGCATPLTPTPTAGHELEIIADPPEAADFLINPKPDAQGAFPAGTVVIIDVLPREGWQVDEWVGPVYAVAGKTARINMDASQTVMIRLVRLETLAPTQTPAPAATPTPAVSPPTPTPPPGSAVHVDAIDVSYDVFQGESDVTFTVAVVDSAGAPVSGATVGAEVLDPTGLAFPVIGSTDPTGIAEFLYTTTSTGMHSIGVLEITGPDLEYTPDANLVRSALVVVPVVVTVTDETGRISTSILNTWSSASQLDEGVQILYAAPDLDAWIDSTDRGEEAEVVGFGAAVVTVPEDMVPVTAALLEELLDE